MVVLLGQDTIATAVLTQVHTHAIIGASAILAWDVMMLMVLLDKGTSARRGIILL